MDNKSLPRTMSKTEAELRAEIKRLREALEFYGNFENYRGERGIEGPIVGMGNGSAAMQDQGRRARKALEE